MQQTDGNVVPSILVWGTTHFGGKSELVIVEGPTKQQVYQRVLRQNLLPWARGTFRNNFVLVQDKAPPHKARATMTFLENQDVKVMDWPAKSPDMNTIEDIWYQWLSVFVIWITLLQHNYTWLSLEPTMTVSVVILCQVVVCIMLLNKFHFAPVTGLKFPFFPRPNFIFASHVWRYVRIHWCMHNTTTYTGHAQKEHLGDCQISQEIVREI